MDIYLQIMGKLISTTPFIHAFCQEMYKKPDEVGLILSLFFIPIEFYLKCCGSTARTWRF